MAYFKNSGTFAVLSTIIQLTNSQSKPTWSICKEGNGFGNCFNSVHSGDCGAVSNLNPVSASVEGM